MMLRRDVCDSLRKVKECWFFIFLVWGVRTGHFEALDFMPQHYFVLNMFLCPKLTCLQDEVVTKKTSSIVAFWHKLTGRKMNNLGAILFSQVLKTNTSITDLDLQCECVDGRFGGEKITLSIVKQ